MNPPTPPRTLFNHLGGVETPSASGETLDDFNPATGALLATLPRSGPADLEQAVLAALEAREDTWGHASLEQRALLLERIAERLEARGEELAALESADTGKPLTLARAVDIPRAVENFRFFAGAIRHRSADFHAMAGAFAAYSTGRCGKFSVRGRWSA